MMVRLVRALEEIRTELRGLTLQLEDGLVTVRELVQDNKLFVADYSVLASLPLREGAVFYSPQVAGKRIGEIQMVEEVGIERDGTGAAREG